MIRTACVLVAVTAATACLPGQKPAWRIPVGGVALYDGTLEWTMVRPDGQPATPVHGTLPHPRMLLHSELTDDRVAMAHPPVDVRWLGPWVAFDLQKPKGSGKVSLRAPDVLAFGEVLLSGSSTATDGDGMQRFELVVESVPPGEGAPTWVRAAFDSTCAGRLVVERAFDPTKGLVTSLHVELDLECRLGARHGDTPAKLSLRQDWRLRAIEGHDTPAFRARVLDAIRQGTAYLRRAIDPSDAGELATADGARSEGEGRLALALLTLLAAGESPHDPVIAAALEDLRRREIRQTYCLALAMMALERSLADPNERDDMIGGLIDAPRPRAPTAGDRALLRDWSQRLLGNLDTSADRDEIARFGYTRGTGFDNSNGQYAALGLWSAHLCGVEQDRELWSSMARHWLQVRYEAAAGGRSVRLVTHRQARDLALEDLRQTGGTVARAATRGFGYRRASEAAPYGSMTCAGITGLTLCRAVLGDRRNALLRQIDDGLDGAFAWLSRYRTVRRNPGDDPSQHDNWFHYWLYSLERACELSSVRYIDGWDWYGDGANLLLETQRHDGAFGADLLVDTCFGVLFLKKAQLPAITGR